MGQPNVLKALVRSCTQRNKIIMSVMSLMSLMSGINIVDKHNTIDKIICSMSF